MYCMEYSILAEKYEKLESVSSKLTKADIIAEFLRLLPSNELAKIVLLLQGRVFPSYSEQELGIATQMMIKAISKASGFSSEKVEDIFKKTGDLGLTAEKCVEGRKQVSLLKRKLTVDHILQNLQKLAIITGEGSQDKKLNLISELIISAQPKEARYIVRTILGELRVGAAEGIIRDAIVKAFLVDEKSTTEEKKKATETVENAWSYWNDYGKIAEVAKEKGIKGLQNVGVQVGKPIQVMLAEKSPSLEDALKSFENCMLQYKYDGARIAIHKKGNDVKLFTRRLEDVTKQFPDIVSYVKKGVKVENCIIEGEAICINPESNEPLPFQILSQRIHRKYDIEKMTNEIPVKIYLFDIVYLNGKSLLNEKYIERFTFLKKSITLLKDKFEIAQNLITKDVKKAEKFYEEAIKAKQEGLIVKNLDVSYHPGRHVGYMLKVKPAMETLDLIVTAATWGEGKRSKWLTSYELSCKDPDTGKLLSVGMMGTGLSEEEYSAISELLKPLIIEEKGKTVKVKPKIIIEVEFEEIQKSPNYESGMALRFRRYIRDRTSDKSEPDTLDRVKSLFKSQGKAG